MFDKTPYERGVEMLETLTSTQRERTEAAITRLRIEWAKLHGDRLPPLLSDHLAVVAALHPQIIDAGHGIGPQSDEVFREIAKEIVEAEPMVQRALDFADEKMKAEIRAEKYGELPPTKRMEMARAKGLDAFLDNAVREELEVRHAMRGE